VSLRWQLLACGDLRWLSWAFVSLRWQSLACGGCRWLSWVFMSLRWLSWLLLAFVSLLGLVWYW
jgi:hypothetical protein